jgi:hypothetical protein
LANLATSLTGLCFVLVDTKSYQSSFHNTPILSLPSYLYYYFHPALFLNQNSLIGTVPIALTKLTKLQYLNVNYNYLTGTLPSYFSTNTFNNASANVHSTFVELR